LKEFKNSRGKIKIVSNETQYELMAFPGIKDQNNKKR